MCDGTLNSEIDGHAKAKVQRFACSRKSPIGWLWWYLFKKKAQILFLLCIRSVCIHLDKLEGQLNKIHNTQKWIEMRKNMNKSSDYCDTYLLNNICRCFITRILNLIVIEFKAHFSKATHIWILYSPVLFFTVNIQIKCTRKVNS